MTKVYQSLTAPVEKYLTITDSRNGRSVDYGIKRELNKYYIYIGKDGKNYVKKHGPFDKLSDTKQFIEEIREEIERLCKLYEKLKERDGID